MTMRKTPAETPAFAPVPSSLKATSRPPPMARATMARNTGDGRTAERCTTPVCQRCGSARREGPAFTRYCGNLLRDFGLPHRASPTWVLRLTRRDDTGVITSVSFATSGVVVGGVRQPGERERRGGGRACRELI